MLPTNNMYFFKRAQNENENIDTYYHRARDKSLALCILYRIKKVIYKL